MATILSTQPNSKTSRLFGEITASDICGSNRAAILGTS